jgi:hypothetical protein
MTAPINMALYRLLLKIGAEEAEAEEAARIDTSELATKTDLTNLKAELIMWMAGLTVAQLLGVLGLLLVLR